MYLLNSLFHFASFISMSLLLLSKLFQVKKDIYIIILST